MGTVANQGIPTNPAENINATSILFELTEIEPGKLAENPTLEEKVGEVSKASLVNISSESDEDLENRASLNLPPSSSKVEDTVLDRPPLDQAKNPLEQAPKAEGQNGDGDKQVQQDQLKEEAKVVAQPNQEPVNREQAEQLAPQEQQPPLQQEKAPPPVQPPVQGKTPTFRETLSSKIAALKANGNVKISAKLVKDAATGLPKVEEHRDPAYPGRVAYKIACIYTIKGKDASGTEIIEPIHKELFTNASSIEEALALFIDAKDIPAQIALQSNGVGGDSTWGKLRESEKTNLLGSSVLKIISENDPTTNVLRIKSFQATTKDQPVDSPFAFSVKDKEYRIDISNKFKATHVDIKEAKLKTFQQRNHYISNKSGKIQRALLLVRNKATLADLKRNRGSNAENIVGIHIHELDNDDKFLNSEFEQIAGVLYQPPILGRLAKVFPFLRTGFIKQTVETSKFLEKYEGSIDKAKLEGNPSPNALNYIQKERALVATQANLNKLSDIQKQLPKLAEGSEELKGLLKQTKDILRLDALPTKVDLEQNIASYIQSLKTEKDKLVKEYHSAKKAVFDERQAIINYHVRLNDLQKLRQDQLTHLETLTKDVKAEKDKLPPEDVKRRENFDADLIRIKELEDDIKKNLKQVQTFTKLIDGLLPGVAINANDKNVFNLS